jgi:hypothetical protein
MLILKLVTYSVTFGAAILFAFLEQRLKLQLTDADFQPSNSPADFGVLNDLSERLQRERILKGLPKQTLHKFKVIVGLKFLFLALLVAEVLFLQK